MGMQNFGRITAVVAFLALSSGMAQAQSVPANSQQSADPAFDEPHDAPPLQVAWKHAGALKPGDTVEITAQGFPPYSPVEIGAGPPQSEYTVLAQSESTAQGTVQAQVTIPASVPADIALVFVVSNQDYTLVARSSPISLSHTPAPTTNPDLISQVADRTPPKV